MEACLKKFNPLDHIITYYLWHTSSIILKTIGSYCLFIDVGTSKWNNKGFTHLC
jgi:hypothetical protein